MSSPPTFEHPCLSVVTRLLPLDSSMDSNPERFSTLSLKCMGKCASLNGPKQDLPLQPCWVDSLFLSCLNHLIADLEA